MGIGIGSGIVIGIGPLSIRWMHCVDLIVWISADGTHSEHLRICVIEAGQTSHLQPPHRQPPHLEREVSLEWDVWWVWWRI